MQIKDSGDRTSYSTGAVRDARINKGMFSLLPVDTLFALAKHFEVGGRKYALRNWEKGIPLSNYYDSAQRHLHKWLRGDRDEPHLIAALWNLSCLYQTDIWIRLGLLPAELNDLPHNDHSIPAEYAEEREEALKGTLSGT